jgi:hypothetical protein
MDHLEAWLIGTPAQLDAAVTALTGIGVHVLPDDPGDHPARHPLFGADRGRHRYYLRICVATAATAPAPPAPRRRRGSVAGGQAVIDLDAHRRTA